MVAAAASPEGRRPRRPQLTKSDLSPEQVRFLELLQDIRYGRIERFLVYEGQPRLECSYEVVRTTKFGRGACSAPKAYADDFSLRAEVVDMFETFDDLGDFVIERLEIRDGLPVFLEVRRRVSSD